MTRSILVVAPDSDARAQLTAALRDARYQVDAAADTATALATLERADVGSVVVALALDGATDVVARARVLAPHAIVLATVAPDGDGVPQAASSAGATDYVLEPVSAADVVARVERALAYRRLDGECAELRGALAATVAWDPLVGESSAVRAVRAQVAALAGIDAPVLLVGPHGAGFEGVARSLHRGGARAARPFLRVDCTALAEPAARLFGVARGTPDARDGVLACAAGGTVHLDDIEALPDAVQAQVLQALATGEVVPVGGRAPVPLDVRVVASTRGDVTMLLAEGRLDPGLHARMANAVVRLPALAERREDLPALVAELVRHHNAALQRHYRGADEAALGALAAQAWPGNLCELDVVVAHAMLVGDGEWIRVENLPRRLSTEEASLLAPANDDLRAAVRAYERMHIQSVLRRLGGNKRTAATRLGVSLSSLYRKLEELGIPL